MNMMGIGTDMVDCQRIAKLLDKYGKRFVHRILSKEEENHFDHSANPGAYLAKRFAAKEALAKALGTGIGENCAFNEISVTNLPTGKPTVQFMGRTKKYVMGQQIKEVYISLSDEKNIALAFVIITK